MIRPLLTMLALLLLAPATAVAASRAMVVVSVGGGIAASSLRTARLLLQSELRARGTEVVDPPGRELVEPLGAKLQSAAAAAGVDVVYALSFSPLGGVVLVSMLELDGNLRYRAERHLQAQDAERLDLELPRLARAFASGEPVEPPGPADAAASGQGESLWGLGILGGLESSAPIGGDLRFVFARGRARFNARIGWANSGGGEGLDLFRSSAGASYLFGSGSCAPYAGADLALLTISTDDGDGGGLAAGPHVGLELLRAHRARLLLEAGVLLPFFTVEDRSGSPASDSYRAIGYASVAVVW